MNKNTIKNTVSMINSTSASFGVLDNIDQATMDAFNAETFAKDIYQKIDLEFATSLAIIAKLYGNGLIAATEERQIEEIANLLTEFDLDYIIENELSEGKNIIVYCLKCMVSAYNEAGDKYLWILQALDRRFHTSFSLALNIRIGLRNSMLECSLDNVKAGYEPITVEDVESFFSGKVSSLLQKMVLTAISSDNSEDFSTAKDAMCFPNTLNDTQKH